MKILIFVGLVSLVSIWSCGPRAAQGLQNIQDNQQVIDEIIWEDWGPPVGPEYNRTFKVNLSRNKQTLSIDSLRSAGVEVVRKLDTKDFDRILALKAEYRIEITDQPLSYDGCVGGEGHNLTFLTEGRKMAEGMVIDCGGKQRTNINGNMFAFFEAIRKLAFPK